MLLAFKLRRSMVSLTSREMSAALRITRPAHHQGSGPRRTTQPIELHALFRTTEAQLPPDLHQKRITHRRQPSPDRPADAQAEETPSGNVDEGDAVEDNLLHNPKVGLFTRFFKRRRKTSRSRLVHSADEGGASQTTTTTATTSATTTSTAIGVTVSEVNPFWTRPQSQHASAPQSQISPTEICRYPVYGCVSSQRRTSSPS